MISVGLAKRKWPFLIVALLAVGLLPPAAADSGSLNEAFKLYDQGRYREARPLLEAAVAAGEADGSTLYRLFFCERAEGIATHEETLAKAREALEREVDDAKSFEPAFYLSNVYATLGLTEENRQLAEKTIARFESGSLAEPKSAIERFRLGKLYAELGSEGPASRWFDAGIEGFANDSSDSFAPYVQWSSRWLGERALRAERYEDAADYYARVVSAGNPTEDDLKSHGLASLVVGRYKDSIEAYKSAQRMNPGGANEYRYGIGLATLGMKTPDLPISPDGERSWEEIGREELEDILRGQGQKVRDVRQEIEAARPINSNDVYNDFYARLEEPRPLFVAAAIEYTRRGLNLRESAFFGGYAPLIFLPREWEMERGARKNRWVTNARELAERRKQREAEREAAEKAPKKDDND